MTWFWCFWTTGTRICTYKRTFKTCWWFWNLGDFKWIGCWFAYFFTFIYSLEEWFNCCFPFTSCLIYSVNYSPFFCQAFTPAWYTSAYVGSSCYTDFMRVLARAYRHDNPRGQADAMLRNTTASLSFADNLYDGHPQQHWLGTTLIHWNYKRLRNCTDQMLHVYM